MPDFISEPKSRPTSEMTSQELLAELVDRARENNQETKRQTERLVAIANSLLFFVVLTVLALIYEFLRAFGVM